MKFCFRICLAESKVIFLCQDFHLQGAIFKNFICSLVFFTSSSIKIAINMDILAGGRFYDLITENREGMRANFKKDSSTLSCIFIFKTGKLSLIFLNLKIILSKHCRHFN